MDHRPTVKDAAGRTCGSVCVDQAIFTSVPSPLSQGYRIIAASPGVRGEEKAEITRRAPSHASLCKTEPDAVALLAYPIVGGRYCVARSHTAGREHTGRGGQRVYTHIALLDQQAWLGFGCNAVRVHAALRQAVGGRAMLKAPPRLAKLLLLHASPEPGSPADAEPATAAAVADEIATEAGLRQTQQVLRLSQAMLHGEHLLVVGSPDEFDLLEKTLSSLPLAIRRSLAVSAGLKYSPSRPVHLGFVSHDQGEAQRAIRGQRIAWFDVDAPPPRASSPYEPWLNLLRRWLEAGREGDVRQLTAAMTEDASPEALARIASIRSAIERVETANAAELDELTSR
jgi:hypothetical protein